MHRHDLDIHADLFNGLERLKQKCMAYWGQTQLLGTYGQPLSEKKGTLTTFVTIYHNKSVVYYSPGVFLKIAASSAYCIYLMLYSILTYN